MCIRDSIYAVGSTHNDVFFIVKYSSGGTVLKNTTYDPPPAGYWDYAYGVDVDSGGNIVVVGSAYAAANDNDWIILKYDSDLNLIYNTTSSYGIA